MVRYAAYQPPSVVIVRKIPKVPVPPAMNFMYSFPWAVELLPSALTYGPSDNISRCTTRNLPLPDVATTTTLDAHSGWVLFRATGLILFARSTIIARPIGGLARRLTRRAGHRSRSPRASAAAGGIDQEGGEPGGPAEDPCRRGATGGPAYRPQCPRTGSARSCGRRASSSGPASPGR